MGISSRVAERISTQLKKYQPILADALARDVSESDTVVIIGDMLVDVLGYKKYVEVTTEHSVRGTFVDLAVKVGNDVRFLVEAKAIGASLKENHVKQAIDYGANNGIEWILLTNGINWRIYKVHFRQPIDRSLVFEFEVTPGCHKSPQIIECLGNLSREGFEQSSMTAFYQQRQILSKFAVASLLVTEPVLNVLRREIRRLSPGCKVDVQELRQLIQGEVVKRDLLDGDEAKQAAEFLKKAARSQERAKAKPTTTPPVPEDAATASEVGDAEPEPA